MGTGRQGPYAAAPAVGICIGRGSLVDNPTCLCAHEHWKYASPLLLAPQQGEDRGGDADRLEAAAGAPSPHPAGSCEGLAEGALAQALSQAAAVLSLVRHVDVRLEAASVPEPGGRPAKRGKGAGPQAAPASAGVAVLR